MRSSLLSNRRAYIAREVVTGSGEYQIIQVHHVLEFPVHPRISSEAFNNLIEEISPIAQQVVNGYASVNVKNKYRYYEVESSYTDEAKLARNKIAEICETVGRDPKNLDHGHLCYRSLG